MGSQFLCRLQDLPDGDSRGFDPLNRGQDSVLVVRRGRRVSVYRDACPHHGTTPMAWRMARRFSGLALGSCRVSAATTT